jgi:hypothetical protein
VIRDADLVVGVGRDPLAVVGRSGVVTGFSVQVAPPSVDVETSTFARDRLET